ncbi:autotransporter domain-containing protein [Pleomorphomonas sp. PLEO]|uniref:autotransporter domain-containing protein n=1 Tax=Pleomorphomonas sp. PLEO TaxID=3239306 RepID=UPI00351DD9DA
MLAGAMALPAGHAWAGEVVVNNGYVGSVNANGPSASNNKLTLTTNANVTADAYGGYTTDPSVDASNNTVVMDSNAQVHGILGGGGTTSGDAIGNSVSLSGGTAWSKVYGGATRDGDAIGNTITISGSAVTKDFVRGGYSDNGSATNNAVTVSGGTLMDTVIGGVSENGTVSGNTVTITGGTLNGAIAGGYAELSATGNTVDISGGTIDSPLIAGGATNSTTATGNTVTISGTPSISSSVILYGGFCDHSSCSGDLFSGNTLNLKTAGLTVGELANFEYLNFYLPTTLTAGGTMLTVTGTADLTNGSGTSSTVNVGINGASSALAVGDSVTLIHAGTLITTAGLNDTATGSGMLGVTLKYVFGISADANDLTATVQSVGVSEQSKALSEGFVSGASFVNQGADLASGKGMANAISAAEAGWSSFGAVSGGSIRTETGSHVDVDGVSLLAGLSKGVDLSVGRLTTGAFAEFGSGSYDTYNGFSSGNVHGEGDSRYVGGGLLGHMDFDAAGPGHAYAEASARFGSAHTSFDSADLTSGGVAAGYDTSSLYAGASAAVGYVWTVNEATTVDVSGKYLWSRLGSDSVQLTTGETVDFDAVTSERTRLGARLSYALSNKVTPYAGAAWEHEFDGKSRATTNGFAIDAPSMSGDTGILEVGLTLKPSDDLPLSVDLGLQGYVGQREGVAGNLQARLAF